MNTLVTMGLVGFLAFSILLFLVANRHLIAFGEEGPLNNRFVRRWPAIDDDEFVRRCSPGAPPETALKVRRIVADQLGIPYDHISPEQSFVNDLGSR